MLRRTVFGFVLLCALLGSFLGGVAPAFAQGTTSSDTMDSASTGLLSTDSDDPVVSYAYENGQFVVRASTSNYAGVAGSLINLPPMTDSQMSIDAAIDGSAVGKFVVVGCRRSDDRSSYEMGIAPDSGEIYLLRQDPDTNAVLAQDTRTDLVHLGNAVNQIGIDCQGTTITGIVNGQPALTATDATYTSGQNLVIVAANGQETDGVTVRLDNLTVTNLDTASGSAALPTAIGGPATLPTVATQPLLPAPVVPALTGDPMLVAVFEKERTAALAQQPMVAGEAGQLPQSDSGFSWAVSPEKTTDLYTIVTFTNPTDLSTPSDMGIVFDANNGPDTGNFLIVQTNGDWSLLRSGGDTIASGTAPTLDTSPGGTNTIELLAQGGVLLIAIDGVVQQQIDFQDYRREGLVFVGTGFRAPDTVVGRVISYQDWWVYPISGS